MGPGTMLSIHDPLMQSSILPLFASVAAIIIFRFAAGADHTARFAGVLVGVVAVAVTIFIVGTPSFPPAGATQKLVYVLGLATLTAAVLPALPGFRRYLFPILLVAIAWIAWPVLAQGRFADLGLVLAILILLLLPFRRSSGSDAGFGLLVLTLVMLVALAITAITFNAASIGQIAAVLAAATGGFMLWNWPVTRHLASPALLVTVPALATLATQMTLFTRSNYWPALIFVAGFAGHECAIAITRNRPFPPPLTLVIQTLVPLMGAAIPLALMILSQPATSSSGY